MDRGILERGGQFNPAGLDQPIRRRRHTEDIAFVQAVSRDNYMPEMLVLYGCGTPQSPTMIRRNDSLTCDPEIWLAIMHVSDDLKIQISTEPEASPTYAGRFDAMMLYKRRSITPKEQRGRAHSRGGEGPNRVRPGSKPGKRG